MDKQRVVFILLAVTVLLSVSSMVFVFSLSVDNQSQGEFAVTGNNQGNVEFVILESPNKVEANLNEGR